MDLKKSAPPSHISSTYKSSKTQFICLCLTTPRIRARKAIFSINLKWLSPITKKISLQRSIIWLNRWGRCEDKILRAVLGIYRALSAQGSIQKCKIKRIRWSMSWMILLALIWMGISQILWKLLALKKPTSEKSRQKMKRMKSLTVDTKRTIYYKS